MFYIESDESDYKSCLVFCDCNDLGHVLRISCFIGKNGEKDPYFEMVFNPLLSIFRRIVISLRYIFFPRKNIRQSYYDGMVINEQDLKEMKKFIDFMLK